MIQLRQVEAFHAVMQAGSMTGAAALLRVTQPAISRMVRDFEQHLGFKLFRRSGKLIEPTAEAALLMGVVERSFQGLRVIDEFARELRSGRIGVLRVAVLPAMAAGFLPRFVARYAVARPQLRIELDGLPSSQIRENVAQGIHELGVVAVPFTQRNLLASPFRDAAVVVMPAEHPLSVQAEVKAADLRGRDLVVLSKFLDGRHSLQAELATVATGRTIGVQLSMMAAAMALEVGELAIIDPFSADEFARQGAVVRPFHPRLSVGTGLVRSRDRQLSAAAAEFHDHLQSHVAAFLRRYGETAGPA